MCILNPPPQTFLAGYGLAHMRVCLFVSLRTLYESVTMSLTSEEVVILMYSKQYTQKLLQYRYHY